MPGVAPAASCDAHTFPEEATHQPRTSVDMASPGVSGYPECGRRGEGAGVGSQAPQLALDTRLHQERWAASSSDGLPVQLRVPCGRPRQALPLPSTRPVSGGPVLSALDPLISSPFQHQEASIVIPFAGTRGFTW